MRSVFRKSLGRVLFLIAMKSGEVQKWQRAKAAKCKSDKVHREVDRIG